MKNFTIGFAALLFSSVTQASSLESIAAKSSFEACSNVKILETQLTSTQSLEYMMQRQSMGYQRMPKIEFLKGISDPRSIAAGLQLMKLVAKKKIENIQTHLDYYSAVKSCLVRSQGASAAECDSILKDFDQNIRSAVPELRRELALSLNYSPGATQTSIPRAHINVALRPIPGLANPAGLAVLTQSEYSVAVADFQSDQEVVKRQLNQKLESSKQNYIAKNTSGLKNFDETPLKLQILQELYAEQMLKHQANYARILVANPHLAFFPAGYLAKAERFSSIEKSSDVITVLQRVLKAGQQEISSIQVSLRENELEFSRIDGEAVWRSYIKGEVELLQFVTSPVMNEVLKDHPHNCALAERLLQRTTLKDLQNFAMLSSVFGIGASSGILGFILKNGLKAGQAAGIGQSLSVAGVLKAASQTSMAVFSAGNAARFYRYRTHAQSDNLAQSPTNP